MPAVHRPLETRDRFLACFGELPVRYAVALDAGFSAGALRRAVQRGLISYLRPGVLWAGGEPPASWAERHRLELRAALHTVADGAYASHDSAAVLHPLARPTTADQDLVQLVSPEAAGFTAPGLVVRASPVPPRDRVVVDGFPCTSIARTAIDLARGRPLWSALIPLDSAARLLVAQATGTGGNALRHAVRIPEHRAHARAELERALDAMVGWAGTVAVREALSHVDPASESAAESRSRAWFLEAGLGSLAPGSPIRCGATTYWADFCAPDQRMIGEVDGWTKYGATSTQMREALDNERRRQRELEAEGWRLVRWSSTDPRRAVVSRMRTALRSA